MKSFLFSDAQYPYKTLALGKFDGMHLAHQALLKHLDEQSALVCIENDNGGEELLTPLAIKKELCKYPILVFPFEHIREKSGSEFLKILKNHFPSLQKLVVGYDFYFGKDRAFNASDLPHLFDGEVVIVPEFKINALSVHSSLIKELIRHGDMEMARSMLGRYYHLQGIIIKGQNLGSKELYPTLNLKTTHFIIPQEGVYATFTKADSILYPSVSFVGHRLSTDRQFSIESHILDTNITLKEQIASIYFVKKIRDNQSFNDLKELKARITSDISESKAILQNAPTKLTGLKL